MEKYLFTDRTNAVREAQSQKELQSLIDASEAPDSIRIWVFNSQAWIELDDYRKKFGSSFRKQSATIKQSIPVTNHSRGEQGKRWLKKFLLTTLFVSGIFLVYNFDGIKWIKASPISIVASRPLNVPVMDLDSLLENIEISRGQKLDKTTRTNLRIRNNWPERIIAQVVANRDSSNAGSRYYDVALFIDNSTGYIIDKAILKLLAWKNGQLETTDTIQFNNISYALAAGRKLSQIYKADSLSIAFEYIKSKAFNFCYSADKKNSFGSSADRWFCRE
jgi:hypothetical protein